MGFSNSGASRALDLLSGGFLEPATRQKEARGEGVAAKAGGYRHLGMSCAALETDMADHLSATNDAFDAYYACVEAAHKNNTSPSACTKFYTLAAEESAGYTEASDEYEAKGCYCVLHPEAVACLQAKRGHRETDA